MKFLQGMELKGLVGRTPIAIEQIDDTEVIFKFADGLRAELSHYQDCCETVLIEDVNGDWQDLVGNPILVAEARTSSEDDCGDNVETPKYDDNNDCELYTFYTFRGIKGSVDMRWYGGGNGYYSLTVDCHWYDEKQ